MKHTLRAFLITGGLLAALVAAYALIEFLRGHVPFAYIEWALGGKFLTITFAVILAIGTLVGYASDVIQARNRR